MRTNPTNEPFSDPLGLPTGGNLNRRQFLEWMAAVTAVVGSGGCMRQPTSEMVPYSRMPESIVPGKALFYATALDQAGEAVGVLVETHMGRPIKLEGNPLHPASRGATDHFIQAEVLSLYDPDRSRAVVQEGRIRTWSAFTRALQTAVARARREGREVRVLTPAVLSPTLAHMLGQWRDRSGRQRRPRPGKPGSWSCS